MAALVLDASVAFSWCFPGDPTEDTPYSRRILKELATRDAVVPDVWSFEIANGIFVSYSKRMRVTERQIADYLGLLMALPIRVEAQGLWANVNLESLARRQNLAAYDAAYLDLALRTGLPIASSDAPLRQAALAQGGGLRGRRRPRACPTLLTAQAHENHAHHNQEKAEELHARERLLEEDARPEQSENVAQRHHGIEDRKRSRRADAQHEEVRREEKKGDAGRQPPVEERGLAGDN